MNSSRQKRRMAGKAILKLDRIVNFSAANRQLFSSGNSASRLPRGYNARVIALTMIALVASAMLSVVAIFCFAWSMPAARVVLPFAVIAAGFGVFGASRIAATPQSGSPLGHSCSRVHVAAPASTPSGTYFSGRSVGFIGLRYIPAMGPTLPSWGRRHSACRFVRHRTVWPL